MSAKDTLCQMLKTLGFEATVTEQNYEDMLLLDIQTDEPNRLIGRQGQTLGEIQYLLNRILHKGDDSVPRVMLDVGGYRREAREQLAKRAVELADKVRRFGNVMEMEPMNAYDRRIVHQALKTDPDIETHSVEVDGSDKKVILLRPRRQAPSSTAT